MQNCCPHTRVLHNLWPSSSRSPHNSASSTDVLSYSAPTTMKDTVLIVLSLTVFCYTKICTVVSCLIYRNCGTMSKQKRISTLKNVIKYFTIFFASNFFSYFPPLKPRCILWSGAFYSPKNTVLPSQGDFQRYNNTC